MRTGWSTTTARGIFRIVARISRTLSCRSRLANGISILAGADKRRRRRSRTHRAPCTQDPANSQKGWKHREWRTGRSTRMKWRKRWRRTRAANSGGRQKTKSTNERTATGWRGEGEGGRATQGVPQKDGERGRGFRTRLCFQAGSPRSRLSSALIARSGLA